MDAWPGPEIPLLPGQGNGLRVYDTGRAAVVDTQPGEAARMFVCGITPYDATHVGHAATYIAFDLVNRVWRDAGQDVHYVQNVTDVDDPLLVRAEQIGEDWRDLADREITLFREDMTALRVLPPKEYVGALEAIPTITEWIERLRERDAAYAVDGDLYFPVAADPSFGSVAHLDGTTMAALFGERGGDPARAGKKDQLDCLLWRAARAGEPSWDSPFGRGRPGWHIECTAIALSLLGNHIDIQGGGSDLAFPHHEMGASHAHVATGRPPFAKAYLHGGMVAYGGAKMSKSRGNLVFVSTLREAGHESAAIRLALLAHHYRSDWEWTPEVLRAAESRLARWRAAVSWPDGAPADRVLTEVRERLADDLDAPGALAAVDAWCAAQESGGGADVSAPGLVSRLADALLGVAL